MKRLLILGSGGHGKVVADCALKTGIYDEIAILDDINFSKSILNIPVIGKFQDAKSLVGEFQNAVVAIGNNKLRINFINKLKSIGYNIPILIHPNSIVSKFTTIEEGTVILSGAVVNAETKIGMGSIVNTCASIEHDCILGKGVHISPGARLGGTVNIGDFTWVCIGSCIINNIDIGSNSIIAAGAVVINNVMNNVMVAGVPAEVKKFFNVNI